MPREQATTSSIKMLPRIAIIKMVIDGEEKVFDMQEEVSFDMTKMSKTLGDHVKSVAFWGIMRARCERELNRRADAYERIRDEEYMRLKTMKQERRLTVEDMRASLRLNKRVQKAERALRSAKANLSTVREVCWIMDHRKAVAMRLRMD